MDKLNHGPWFVEVGDVRHVVDTAAQAIPIVTDAFTRPRGRIDISHDDGARPWWQRFLGASPRYVSGFAAIEWADDFACLIFLDDTWSEYRVVDAQSPVQVPPGIRTEIAHGESTTPDRHCMRKQRGVDGLLEALRTGVRPAWLSYDVVE